MRGKTRRWRAHDLILLVSLGLGVFLGHDVNPAVADSDPHAFNAVLSLTGSCKVSLLDPVPDPAEPECPFEAPAEHPPSGEFTSPRGLATDRYGNSYIVSYGKEGANGKEGRIDIFDSKGFFITEIADPNGPKDVAVDSNGYLYVFDFASAEPPSSSGVRQIVRYKPTVYNPAAGEVSYEEGPKLVTNENLGTLHDIAVDPTNDHLFVLAAAIREYKSALEGNEKIDEFGEKELGILRSGLGLAIDAAHNRIYASGEHSVLAFELGPPHALLLTVTGSDFGAPEFAFEHAIAADEKTGHFFIYDFGSAKKVYELAESGEYLTTIEHSFQPAIGAQLVVDNGPNSPNGALNPRGRCLYVTSGTGAGHLYAFCLPPQGPPIIETTSFDDVTETEAQLHAAINPQGLETAYTFEYITQKAFEEEGGFGAAAVVAGEGEIPAGSSAIPVSAFIEGLEPGTAYRFRISTTNEEGSDEAEGSFSTYPEEPEPPLCPNEALRIGPSALLPDCRAYELVTPPDTNAREPIGVGHLGTYFATRQSSPLGDAVAFQIEGGSLPEAESTGSYAGDPYFSTRTEAGWKTTYAGPSGEESPAILPGSNSPDQGYSFWQTANGEGSAAVGGQLTSYIHYPDGHSELIGRGSLDSDPHAHGDLISEDGGHIVFTSTLQLEENAPPGGTVAIYDRTADEVTHVVSLLPNNETPPDGESAHYEGASLDGKGVAFTIGSTLYLRFDNEETYEVAGPSSTFAGVAEGGKRIFYLEGDNLYAYEVGGTENPIAFSTTGDVTPVNVSADGSTAYFVSPSVLGEENPNEEVAQPGQENLYRSEEGVISFVGTVTERDVKGENGGNEIVDGLGLWVQAVGQSAFGGPGRFGEDPSRTTPDGGTLLFSSRAALDGYDPEGHPEIYRYNFAGNELDCLSCNPTLAPASGDASLQSVTQQQGDPEPFSSYAFVENLRPSGDRAFFQSTEALVLGDTDGLQDVYEWEANGVGSCEEAGGCLYLISSGQSERIDYLWGVSNSGDDVFFRSSDLLTGADTDETPSIYDARVEGGFAEPPSKECQEDTCGLPQPPTPTFPLPATPPTGRSGNWIGHTCPKGKRLVKRHGKKVCIKKKKHRKRHRRRAGSKRKGAIR